MKTHNLLLILAFFALISPAAAQSDMEADTGKYEKAIESININESENKQKLLEELDQVKLRLDEKEYQHSCLEKSRKHLRHYKEEIDNVRYDIIQRSLKTIARYYLKRDKDMVSLEENRLKSRLRRFIRFYESNDTLLYGYAGIDTRRDFYKLFESMLSDLRSTEPFPVFLSYPSDVLFIKSLSTFDSLHRVLNRTRMNELLSSLEEANARENDYILASEFRIEREINHLKYTKRMIMDKLSEDVDIDFFSILLGLPLFCVTVLVLFVGPGFIQSKYGNGTTNPLLEKSQNILLDLSTVLLLTMSVLILGLSGNINSDVLGTLIGGISGYVLNKAKG